MLDMKTPGHRHPAAARAHRARVLQRGVLRRRVRPRRLPRRPRARRLARHPHVARQRAGLDGQRLDDRPRRPRHPRHGPRRRARRGDTAALAEVGRPRRPRLRALGARLPAHALGARRAPTRRAPRPRSASSSAWSTTSACRRSGSRLLGAEGAIADGPAAHVVGAVPLHPQPDDRRRHQPRSNATSSASASSASPKDPYVPCEHLGVLERSSHGCQAVLGPGLGAGEGGVDPGHLRVAVVIDVRIGTVSRASSPRSVALGVGRAASRGRAVRAPDRAVTGRSSRWSVGPGPRRRRPPRDARRPTGPSPSTAPARARSRRAMQRRGRACQFQISDRHLDVDEVLGGEPGTTSSRCGRCAGPCRRRPPRAGRRVAPHHPPIGVGRGERGPLGAGRASMCGGSPRTVRCGRPRAPASSRRAPQGRATVEPDVGVVGCACETAITGGASRRSDGAVVHEHHRLVERPTVDPRRHRTDETMTHHGRRLVAPDHAHVQHVATLRSAVQDADDLPGWEVPEVRPASRRMAVMRASVSRRPDRGATKVDVRVREPGKLRTDELSRSCSSTTSPRATPPPSSRTS